MKTALTVLGITIAFISYVPYFRDIFAGKTKPHAFTWFVWCLLTGIAFFAQLSDGGGVGSLILGFTTIIALFVFIAAIKVGRKDIERIDWFFLASSLAALALWLVTSNPFWSVILITVVDAIAFAPTFRKAYHNPYTETLITYLLSGIKFIIVLLALKNYSVITVLYPLSLIVMNSLFVFLLYTRRKVINPPKKMPVIELELELI